MFTVGSAQLVQPLAGSHRRSITVFNGIRHVCLLSCLEYAPPKENKDLDQCRFDSLSVCGHTHNFFFGGAVPLFRHTDQLTCVVNPPCVLRVPICTADGTTGLKNELTSADPFLEETLNLWVRY